jgi:hypothetical protein
MEGVLLIATIAQKWKLRLAPNQAVVPRPNTLTLGPKDGLKMTVEVRDAAPLRHMKAAAQT